MHTVGRRAKGEHMSIEAMISNILGLRGTAEETLRLLEKVSNMLATPAAVDDDYDESPSITKPESGSGADPKSESVADPKSEPKSEPEGPASNSTPAVKTKMKRRVTGERMGKRYTEEEKIKIGQHLDDDVPLSVVAAAFGRSAAAIEQMLARGKITSSRYPASNNFNRLPDQDAKHPQFIRPLALMNGESHA